MDRRINYIYKCIGEKKVNKNVERMILKEIKKNIKINKTIQKINNVKMVL